MCGSCSRKAVSRFQNLREGRIEELEAPVGPEEGDALVEIVEGLALHADQLVVAALQLDLACVAFS